MCHAGVLYFDCHCVKTFHFVPCPHHHPTTRCEFLAITRLPTRQPQLCPLHELAEAIRVDKAQRDEEINYTHQALQVEFRRLALRNSEVEESIPRGAEESEERRVEHAALGEEMGWVRGLMERVENMRIKQEALGRLGEEVEAGAEREEEERKTERRRRRGW